MDALYFTLLSKAAEDPSCQCIVNGSPLHESVNHFKKQFLFRAIAYPCYSSNAWLVKMVKKLMYKKSRQTRPITQGKDGCRAVVAIAKNETWNDF
jgi:hypothetical protein